MIEQEPLSTPAANDWALNVYWPHFPPEVRALRTMPQSNPDEIAAKGLYALQLSDNGFDIDVPIMVWDFHPYYTMYIRMFHGYAQACLYGNGKPIRVSIDPKDYPPFDPPPPPPAPPDTTVIGAYTGFLNRYFCGPAGISVPDREKRSDSRGTFVKRITRAPMGEQHFWEKQ